MSLKSLVPNNQYSDSSMHKLTILQNTIDYILQLQLNVSQLQYERQCTLDAGPMSPAVSPPPLPAYHSDAELSDHSAAVSRSSSTNRSSIGSYTGKVNSMTEDCQGLLLLASTTVDTTVKLPLSNSGASHSSSASIMNVQNLLC